MRFTQATGWVVLVLACAGSLALGLGRGNLVAAQDDGSVYAAGTDVVEDEATLEIHKAECYTGVGPDIYQECHDNAVEGVLFTVNGATGATDSEGWVGFHGAPSTVTITEGPEAFDLYLGAYVYCRDLTDDEVLYDDSATDSGGVVVLEILAGDQVVCDWYDIYDGTDDDDDLDGVGGVKELPNTGVGPSPSVSGQGTLAILTLITLSVVAYVGRRRLVR